MQSRAAQTSDVPEVMDGSAVRDQIDRILRSQSFANKGQLRRLLEILRNNLESQSALSTHGVIQELWPGEIKTKRPADLATEMNRLRHALETFYGEEGNDDPIVITLPSRSPAALDGSGEKRWIVAKPRISEAEQSPPSQRIRRRNFNPILVIAAAVALGIGAYVSIRLLSFPDQPRSGRLDGSTLIILDAKGKELWRKVFPDKFGPDWYYRDYLHSGVWFADLEGKGHTSVLFVYSSASPELSSSTLICYSDRGKEKWRWTPGRNLPELNGAAPTYQTFALGVLKATNKSPARIVVSSAHAIWWPTQIAVLDANGKTLSEYWHSGRLDYMVLADLDGDGRQEIIATGVANGYDHQATLVVLDPDRMFGASTEIQPEFQMHGMGTAQERLRLLFPRSDLNRALYQFNQAVNPTVDSSGVRLQVRECITPPGCRIWYEFDKRFRLIAAFAGGDEFRSAHERFYQAGKNAHTLSAQEQAAFQKVRCLVGCKTEFVPVGKLVP
jgi:hypothetical protein